MSIHIHIKTRFKDRKVKDDAKRAEEVLARVRSRLREVSEEVLKKALEVAEENGKREAVGWIQKEMERRKLALQLIKKTAGIS